MKLNRKNRPHGPGGAARSERGLSSNSIGHYKAYRNSIPIYAGDKVIGEVENDTFYKSIKGSKHILRQPKAIAFDIDSLLAAKEAGARQVRILNTETGDVYWSPINQIWQRGVEFDRGYGRQIFLLLEYWLKPGENAVYQPSLFGD